MRLAKLEIRHKIAVDRGLKFELKRLEKLIHEAKGESFRKIIDSELDKMLGNEVKKLEEIVKSM